MGNNLSTLRAEGERRTEATRRFEIPAAPAVDAMQPPRVATPSSGDTRGADQKAAAVGRSPKKKASRVTADQTKDMALAYCRSVVKRKLDRPKAEVRRFLDTLFPERGFTASSAIASRAHATGVSERTTPEAALDTALEFLADVPAVTLVVDFIEPVLRLLDRLPEDAPRSIPGRLQALARSRLDQYERTAVNEASTLLAQGKPEEAAERLESRAAVFPGTVAIIQEEARFTGGLLRAAEGKGAVLETQRARWPKPTGAHCNIPSSYTKALMIMLAESIWLAASASDTVTAIQVDFRSRPVTTTAMTLTGLYHLVLDEADEHSTWFDYLDRVLQAQGVGPAGLAFHNRSDQWRETLYVDAMDAADSARGTTIRSPLQIRRIIRDAFRAPPCALTPEQTLARKQIRAHLDGVQAARSGGDGMRRLLAFCDQALVLAKAAEPSVEQLHAALTPQQDRSTNVKVEAQLPEAAPSEAASRSSHGAEPLQVGSDVEDDEHEILARAVAQARTTVQLSATARDAAPAPVRIIDGRFPVRTHLTGVALDTLLNRCADLFAPATWPSSRECALYHAAVHIPEGQNLRDWANSLEALLAEVVALVFPNGLPRERRQHPPPGWTWARGRDGQSAYLRAEAPIPGVSLIILEPTDDPQSPRLVTLVRPDDPLSKFYRQQLHRDNVT